MNEEKSIVVPASEIKADDHYSVKGNDLSEVKDIFVEAPTVSDKPRSELINDL